MRYYETLYIVNPDYEDERLGKIQSDVDDWVSQNGGKIINSYVWGRRKLAYPVDSQQYGTYVLLHFGVEPPDPAHDPFILELNKWLELNSAILAYMTVHLDEEPRSKAVEEKSTQKGG
ncbi:MAG: 30S ribosomal protein S6 [Fidelibacterota bacterium]